MPLIALNLQTWNKTFTENRDYLTKLFKVLESSLSGIYYGYATTH